VSGNFVPPQYLSGLSVERPGWPFADVVPSRPLMAAVTLLDGERITVSVVPAGGCTWDDWPIENPQGNEEA
jgi:hypothetical protein